MKTVTCIGAEYLIGGQPAFEVRTSPRLGIHIVDLGIDKVAMYLITNSEAAHKYALQMAEKAAASS